MGELKSRVEVLRWDGSLQVLDQRLLPWEERWVSVESVSQAVALIQSLAVRGAPLLGLVAAYALALEAQRCPHLDHLEGQGAALAKARPTAVNLPRAVAKMLSLARQVPEEKRGPTLLAAAQQLHREETSACQRMAELGAGILAGPRLGVLTHCNTGVLATGGVGTALGVVRALHAQGRLAMLYAGETRPVLQGARLTVWEAQRDGIPVTLLPDGAAGSLLASGAVGAVVVGADRIAADGSVANKVGTYPLAVLAQRHGVPFVVVAPTSTLDPHCPTGSAIPIEHRQPEEVTHWQGKPWLPFEVTVYNPAFDVTPPELIMALVCERGVVTPVTQAGLAEFCS
ncbi:MAG: S-methyl-5-thioribose-1-phosphate isomerase [Thermoanaerobaculum sp.]|nr:S-methyl-5-thioribose-1-phosphate isomerase [Thermoanaerobaculum sp.]MDW7968109.1 S-methyl-5-thioribose-1-phosphate isomerase [Thermoanaerobaculum sp.]